jgi:hypothetical protein
LPKRENPPSPKSFISTLLLLSVIEKSLVFDPVGSFTIVDCALAVEINIAAIVAMTKKRIIGFMDPPS